MSRETAKILNTLHEINERITKIAAAQAETNQALTMVAKEQISQRESQFRLERRVINHINTEEETVREGH